MRGACVSRRPAISHAHYSSHRPGPLLEQRKGLEPKYCLQSVVFKYELLIYVTGCALKWLQTPYGADVESWVHLGDNFSTLKGQIMDEETLLYKESNRVCIFIESWLSRTSYVHEYDRGISQGLELRRSQ